MEKILVIPDVHGREFWKRAKEFPGKIVFLGDYLDPYNFEFALNGEYKAIYNGMEVRYNEVEDRRESCIENFKEIIEFAKSRDNVILLLGNHDYHYIYSGMDSSRKDNLRSPEIKQLYSDNIDLFKEFHAEGKILFTHAGLTKEWINFNFKEDVDYKKAFSEAKLWQKFQVSGFRGGRDTYSGPLWEDIAELEYLADYEKDHLYTDSEIEFQIFGHTMQVYKGEVIFTTNGACIDSREVFEVDPENPKDTLKVWE